MSKLWHCLILLGVLEVFWFYATLIIFVDNNNNNKNMPTFVTTSIRLIEHTKIGLRTLPRKLTAKSDTESWNWRQYASLCAPQT